MERSQCRRCSRARTASTPVGAPARKHAIVVVGLLVVMAPITACAGARQTVVADPEPAGPAPSATSAAASAGPGAATPVTPAAGVRPAPLSPPAHAVNPRESRLGPQDLVEVKIFEAPEMDRTVRVATDGTLHLPLLGDVSAEGMTPRELEEDIEGRLRGTYILDPHVSVGVLEVLSQPVYVVGSVRTPGVVQVRGSSTLLEVIAMAGGLDENAGESVILMRPSAEADPADPAVGADAREVNLRNLLKGTDPGFNLPVFAGDIVKVQEAGLVYVVGEVQRPGAFPVTNTDPLSVMKAVALAEGLLPNAAKSRALLIRSGATGDRTEVPLDLDRIVQGREPDPQIQENDIIYIPKSGPRSLASGVLNALVSMVTLRAIF